MGQNECLRDLYARYHQLENAINRSFLIMTGKPVQVQDDEKDEDGGGDSELVN